MPPGGVAARGLVNGGDPLRSSGGDEGRSPEPIRRQVGSPAGNIAGRALADANLVGVPMTELKEGQRIEHNRFGPGTILELSGSVPDMKAKIRFDAFGEKLLLLKYAKIRPLQG